jgi:hypothetical protein
VGLTAKSDVDLISIQINKVCVLNQSILCLLYLFYNVIQENI